MKMCSKGIGMVSQKCGVYWKWGELLNSGDKEMSNGEKMKDPNDGHKTLGILEMDNILHKELKDKAITAYFKSLKIHLDSTQ